MLPESSGTYGRHAQAIATYAGRVTRQVPDTPAPLGTASPRLTRRWVAVWLAVVAWTVVCAVSQTRPSGISWHFFDEGSRALFHRSGLHTYAQHPDLQIGPLALLVAGAIIAAAGPHALGVAQVLMTSGLLVALALLASLVPPRARHTRMLLVGLVAAPSWTVLSVRWAHLDDVLALVLLAACLVAVRHGSGHPLLAGLALAGACAAKPWAVIGIPLLLVLGSGRLRSAVYAAAGTAAAWAPFLVADPGTLAALHPPVRVADSSAMWWLGYRGTYLPTWDRMVQLVGAPLAALVAVLRGAWPGALLAGIAVRLLLDPQNLAYYAAGAVLAAIVADLLGQRSVVPWTAMATALLLWQPFVEDYPRRLQTSQGLTLWWFEHPGAIAIIHSTWSLLAIGVSVWWLPRLRSRVARGPMVDEGLLVDPAQP